MPTTQVAVRLDSGLLEQVDWLVDRCDFESRAEVIRAALEALAQHERDRQIDEQIVDAYRRMPQTDAEVDGAGSRGFPGLGNDDDWSEWL